MPNFVNRERELRALERACGDEPGLVVVSGRRRVGKTALLDRFSRDRARCSSPAPGRRSPTTHGVQP